MKPLNKWEEIGFLSEINASNVFDLFECEASYILGEQEKVDTKMGKLKKIIHINQHVIKSNTKTGEIEPVITCKTYKENKYGHQVVIKDDYGKEVARIIYSPDKPLSCGARVWIETNNEVEVIEEFQNK